MRVLILALLASMLTGCTVASEVFSPHRDLKSPCACIDDATPINAALLVTAPIIFAA